MTDRHTTNTTPATPLPPEREAQLRTLLESGEALSANAGWALLGELDRVRAERDQLDAQLLTARGDIAAEGVTR